MTPPSETTVLAVLAGGAARRLGGADKALLAMGDGRPLLAHLVDRLAPWPGPVVLCAGGDPARFAAFGLPVVADTLREPDGRPAGPLAGLLAALEWTRAVHPGVAWLVSVPGDLPVAPPDLLARLWATRARSGATVVRAASGGRIHHAVALWPVARATALRHALTAEGLRRVDAWAGRHRGAVADWPADPVDPFLNVNTPADLARARALTAPRY
ncbi:molybdenum cofactor guanylyltransferase MobA [Roseospira goensis]|uniref:Molybdenum cofactor guanylyltransferase n=1 Tax=Roseospira goensis TaxID=391922 RepID=A0A7W6WKP3_9PROT|nr:molybdenum cofactor guanylyltransferase MobA [Roseospira goensis]MBB4286305.1 molybdopterin-guanine dinucleotide biosynthesis protein A [Roseospira goensis]